MLSRERWIPGALPFFAFGSIYYVISPAFVFQFLSDDSDLLSAAGLYLAAGHFGFAYFLDALIGLVSFYLGYSFTRRSSGTGGSALDYGSQQRFFPLFLAFGYFALIVYFVLLAVATGSGFFTGYQSYNDAILGPFSTCVFLSAWFVNFFSEKFIRLLFSIFFIFCSVLLLGWGSRMYFVLGLLALVIGLVSQRSELLKSWRFYASVCSAGLFVLVVGILREDGTELNFDRFLAIFFAEPLFTATTGFLYLENSGGRPGFSFPRDLYASVIHFVPSFLYPEKAQVVIDISFNEHVESPFGGTALLVNLYSNFGMLYPVFIALIGSYYGVLFRRAAYSSFFRATYFSALPLLLFLFYRDGLATIMKVMFFNGLIVPYISALVLILISSSSSSTVSSVNQ